ncbi:hypothetical protein QQS21_006340 [Conoideocrella luteorostrata]|uniref:SnoaL-like domain-containing protein n=1 Tax=Conoideocrella luteorostrata TaxID=1105319 RepID=A0AAJ0G098_9HYPO|nr:hypothetical protein QQS21_006340 [Conoideocrella luteorostrata]
MLLTTVISLILGALPSEAVASKCCPGVFKTHEHHARILQNYVDIWAGNLSLIDSTLAPALSLQIDRFPTGSHGSVPLAPTINSSAAFSSFVQSTRSNFDKYGFTVQKWAGEDRHISLRWTMEAVLGDKFKAVPTTLKAGDAVTYNGTEFLTLDPCTGLVVEVDSAQDLITFMYNLGNDINLTPLKKA